MTTRFAVALGLAVGLAAAAQPQDAPATKVVVEGQSLTFDPKTCAPGRGQFAWGLGSCAVNVLGRTDGKCRFEYTQEVEMGSTVYLVEVPVTAGPVTVKIDRVTRMGSTYSWPVTSFPLDKAKVIRTAGGAGFRTVRVGEPDLFVTIFPGEGENRSEMAPRKGDAVKCRFELFAGRDFKTALPGAAFRPTAEFVAGSDAVWPWLAVVLDGMTVGDRRRVEVPVKAAPAAAVWLPKGSTATVLYVEVGLRSVAPRK
jgi:hypothetical protein